MMETEVPVLSKSREDAVRAELDHLLESAAFRTSKRCREFLEYVVEHTIGGPIGSLKERSIGVELFQLPQDFDTGQHTVVRVTANEVRKKLAQHYLGENGTHHPVRIELPPGSYSADFKFEEAPVAVAPAPAPARRIPWRAIACAAVVVVVAGVFSLWRWKAIRPIAVDAKSPPIPAAMPKAAPGGDLRFIVGSTNSYIDRSGRIWSPDRFFSGGSVLVRPAEKIARTLDPDIYRHIRQGDFR